MSKVQKSKQDILEWNYKQLYSYV